MTLLSRIAEQLWAAQLQRQPCAPVRELFVGLEGHEQAAYAVQQHNVNRQLQTGRRIVGRKIGLTSHAVQKQLGVNRPDFGTLLDDMGLVDGETIDTGRLLQPKVEAEIALVLQKDLRHERHTVADLIGATAYGLSAIEIVASRIAGWDIRFLDTVADNASAGMFVLGTQPVPLFNLDLAGVRMRLTRGEQVLAEGIGAACLGNPLNAARWLADTMVREGTPLQAGDVVLTGALGPMVTVESGQTYTTYIDGFAPVHAAFS